MDSARSGRVARWAPRVVVIWASLVVVYWGVLIVQARDRLSTIDALESAVRLAIVPALLGLVSWWITGKVPIPERRLWQFTGAHLLLAAAAGVIFGLWAVLPLLAGVNPAVNAATVWRNIFPWQVITGVFLYGLMAAVSYAIRGAVSARELRVVTERAERLRVQAELASLRAHINPHFLFNTLHTVTQLLRGDPVRAEAALERLSTLFRYTLKLDRQRVEVVSLEEEWAFTQSYLWLEQIRMGDRLRLEATLTDDALDCAVPPFTLQPLVENAIRHGLGPSRDGGELRIGAIVSAKTLVITVRDDGVGADAGSLDGTPGIGVRAVRQRLEARHGGAASVAIDPAPGRGFLVTLTLPAEHVQ